MAFTSNDSFFENVFLDVFQRRYEVHNTSFLSGGCINNTLKVTTSEGPFFLKWHKNIPPDMFEKEALGLRLLREAGAVPVPNVFGHGTINGNHYLLMEFVDAGPPGRDYWSRLGASLAEQHKANSHTQYGLDTDNYIGRLPQSNSWSEDWIRFLVTRRLEPQLQLAIEQGAVDSGFAARYRKLYERLGDLLPTAPPSLLHGDLWSGNVMTGPEGIAWIIDPAVYYGHREIELSFTRMFGGFGVEFYDAYEETWPLEPGFEDRVDIYNIYPSMVHVNLFGQSYLSGVARVLKKYV